MRQPIGASTDCGPKAAERQRIWRKYPVGAGVQLKLSNGAASRRSSRHGGGRPDRAAPNTRQLTAAGLPRPAGVDHDRGRHRHIPRLACGHLHYRGSATTMALSGRSTPRRRLRPDHLGLPALHLGYRSQMRPGVRELIADHGDHVELVTLTSRRQASRYLTDRRSRARTTG